MSVAIPGVALSRGRPFGDPTDRAIVVAGCMAAAAVGMAVGAQGQIVGLAVAALVLMAVCAWHPVAATYLYIGTLPLLAGVNRGVAIPLLRPNELLLAIVVAGATTGGILRLADGARWPRLIPRLDVPLAVFLLLCTVWALASMTMRGVMPGSSDFAAVLPVCKLGALFLLVRLTVTTHERLVRCVRLVVWSAVVVAVIAVLQTTGFSPVIGFLGSLDPTTPEATIAERGSTTLGSPIATGDVILIALLLVITCGVRGILGARERMVAGLIFAAGVLAAGQFSTWIAAAVAALLLLRAYPSLRRAAVRFLPLVAVAMLVGAPAFVERLGGFRDGEELGAPPSWQGRWDNLSEFYIPRLFESGHFLIGVSPNSVLPAPETWREVIYLESGYLQLLWIGGVPLLVGFAWLSVAVLGRARELAWRSDAVGACASALWIAWWLLIILSVLDPHLFLRGTGDLLFTLLAVTAGGLAGVPSAPQHVRTRAAPAARREELAARRS